MPTFGGIAVPSLVYGTAWKEERTEQLTALALQAGFRGIDTANQRRHYFEAGAGAAIAAAIATGQVARKDLFLQTKFTYARGQDHRLPYDPRADHATQVAQSFASSLVHLGTDYIDSFVLHGPEQGSGLTATDWDVWRAMEDLARSGKARALGASNIEIDQLELLLADAKIPPAFVQNRCYASDGWDRDVRELCIARGIGYQGFSLLTANKRELSSPAVREVVARTGKTLPQVVFRFAIHAGMIPLTGTSNPTHMAEDLACTELELSEADVRTLELCGRA
jgi:diketogulonate reductase-like aldo/keto reductase